MASELVVKILGDERDVKRALNTSEKEVGGFTSKVGGIFKNLQEHADRRGHRCGILAGASILKDFGGQLMTAGTEVDVFGKKSKTVFEDSMGTVTD